MHPSMEFTQEQLFKTLSYMNDDLLDLTETPDMFSLIVGHYIYEAEVYLLKFEELETKEIIQNYINNWKELYKKNKKIFDTV